MTLLKLMAGLVVGLAPVVATPLPSSEGPGFRPAAFGDSARSLPAVFRCPGTTPVPVDASVMCRTVVRARGTVQSGRGTCLSTPAQADYRRATERALAKAEFLPALVAGKPVAVTMTFRVAIHHAGTACKVSAIPNPGLDDTASGIADVAPQRIVPERRAFALRSTLDLPLSVQTSRSAMLILYSVPVAVDGTPGDPRVEIRHEALPTSEVAELLRSHEGSRYIPGQRGGQPAAMPYFFWL